MEFETYRTCSLLMNHDKQSFGDMIHCFSYENNYIMGGTKVTDPPSLDITEVASLDFLPALLTSCKMANMRGRINILKRTEVRKIWRLLNSDIKKRKLREEISESESKRKKLQRNVFNLTKVCIMKMRWQHFSFLWYAIEYFILYISHGYSRNLLLF